MNTMTAEVISALAGPEGDVAKDIEDGRLIGESNEQCEHSFPA
jgi:hypothetical protein